MKKYLTLVFFMASVLILSIGLRTNFQFKVIISWGLAFICLSFATYYTRYIPNDCETNKNSLKEELAKSHSLFISTILNSMIFSLIPFRTHSYIWLISSSMPVA